MPDEEDITDLERMAQSLPEDSLAVKLVRNLLDTNSDEEAVVAMSETLAGQTAANREGLDRA